MPTTSNFGWTTPADTDLVKNGALAIRTLGNGIDTSLIDLKGGTTGQILSKASNTDLDYTWINNDQGDITEVQAGTGISVASGTGPIPIVTNTVATAFDAKGDLVVGTGADTFSKLTVGTNNFVLTADSSTSTGLKWAAAAAGGKVLQVVSATNTATQSTTSTTFVDAITVSITPTANTSKFLIFGYISGASDIGASQIPFRITRDSTAIFVGDASGNRLRATGVLFQPSNANYSSQADISFLDAPATTSAITYKVQYSCDPGSTTTVYLGRNYNDTNNVWSIRSPSAGITVMEIGA